jgi:hypothetical protein
LDKSAIAKHSINLVHQEANKSGCMECIIRGMIEIELHCDNKNSQEHFPPRKSWKLLCKHLKQGRSQSLRKSDLLHTDLTIPESALFRDTFHTAPVRVTFTSFLACSHLTQATTPCNGQSNTLPLTSLTASWSHIGMLLGPFPCLQGLDILPSIFNLYHSIQYRTLLLYSHLSLSARTGLFASISVCTCSDHCYTTLLPSVISIIVFFYLLLTARLCPLLYSMPILMHLSQCHSFHPENGGSRVLWSVGILLQHTAQCHNPGDSVWMSMNQN